MRHAGSARGFMGTLGILLAGCAAGEPPWSGDTGPAGDDGDQSADLAADAGPDTPVDSPPDRGADLADRSGPDGAADSGPDLEFGITDTPDTPDTPDTGDPGDLCTPCDDHDDCGGPADWCLQNADTGEVFCGRDCSRSPCPAGYSCATISTETGTIDQCIPDDGSCDTGPTGCDPPCGTGEVCLDGRCVPAGDWEAEQQHCVDEINSYRATLGLAPLARSASLEACATEGAEEDSRTGIPHGHFSRTGGCGIAFAENEIPGWPLSAYGSVTRIIDGGLAMMWAEGPGGGHYEIMRGPYRAVGCGIHVTTGGAVWVVNDFN